MLCLDTPHKPSVKIGTGAPLPVLQKGKQSADINWRDRLMFMVTCFTLEQVQSSSWELLQQPEGPWLLLIRETWWALQGKNEVKTIPILPWAVWSYSFLKVASLVCRVSSSAFSEVILTDSTTESTTLQPGQTVDAAFQRSFEWIYSAVMPYQSTCWCAAYHRCCCAASIG